MSARTSVVDVAFRATTFGLFATTCVAGAWFTATAAKGFLHYSAASEAVASRRCVAKGAAFQKAGSKPASSSKSPA